jgi:hypothetical protein
MKRCFSYSKAGSSFRRVKSSFFWALLARYLVIYIPDSLTDTTARRVTGLYQLTKYLEGDVGKTKARERTKDESNRKENNKGNEKETN